jgi:hypothetical protein
MVLAELFQSDGTVQEVPEVRTTTVAANACAGSEKRNARKRKGKTEEHCKMTFLKTISI